MFNTKIQAENMSFESLKNIINLLGCHIKHEDKISGEITALRTYGLNLETLNFKWNSDDFSIDVTTQYNATFDRVINALKNNGSNDFKPHKPVLPTKVRRFLIAGILSSVALLSTVFISYNLFIGSDFYKESYVKDNAADLCIYWTKQNTSNYAYDKNSIVSRASYYSTACEHSLVSDDENTDIRYNLGLFYIEHSAFEQAEMHFNTLKEQGYYSGYDGLITLYDKQGKSELAVEILTDKLQAKIASKHDTSSENVALSKRFLYGNGVPKNFNKARKLYELSNINNYKNKDLGKLYYDGLGGSVDKVNAKKLGYEPPKDQVQYFADQVISKMKTGGTCATFSSRIEQIAYSDSPANIREIQIEKLIDVADRYRCLNY